MALLPDIISLNVGGTHKFDVRRKTLTKFEDSALARMFSQNHGEHPVPPDKDEHGRYVLEADGQTFPAILDYLMYGRLPLPETSDKNYLDHGANESDSTAPKCHYSRNGKYEVDDLWFIYWSAKNLGLTVLAKHLEQTSAIAVYLRLQEYREAKSGYKDLITEILGTIRPENVLIKSAISVQLCHKEMKFCCDHKCEQPPYKGDPFNKTNTKVAAKVVTDFAVDSTVIATLCYDLRQRGFTVNGRQTRCSFACSKTTVKPTPEVETISTLINCCTDPLFVLNFTFTIHGKQTSSPHQSMDGREPKPGGCGSTLTKDSRQFAVTNRADFSGNTIGGFRANFTEAMPMALQPSALGRTDQNVANPQLGFSSGQIGGHEPRMTGASMSLMGPFSFQKSNLSFGANATGHQASQLPIRTHTEKPNTPSTYSETYNSTCQIPIEDKAGVQIATNTMQSTSYFSPTIAGQPMNRSAMINPEVLGTNVCLSTQSINTLPKLRERSTVPVSSIEQGRAIAGVSQEPKMQHFVTQSAFSAHFSPVNLASYRQTGLVTQPFAFSSNISNGPNVNGRFQRDSAVLSSTIPANEQALWPTVGVTVPPGGLPVTLSKNVRTSQVPVTLADPTLNQNTSLGMPLGSRFQSAGLNYQGVAKDPGTTGQWQPQIAQSQNGLLLDKRYGFNSVGTSQGLHGHAPDSMGAFDSLTNSSTPMGSVSSFEYTQMFPAQLHSHGTITLDNQNLVNSGFSATGLQSGMQDSIEPVKMDEKDQVVIHDFTDQQTSTYESMDHHESGELGFVGLKPQPAWRPEELLESLKGLDIDEDNHDADETELKKAVDVEDHSINGKGETNTNDSKDELSATFLGDITMNSDYEAIASLQRDGDDCGAKGFVDSRENTVKKKPT